MYIWLRDYITVPRRDIVQPTLGSEWYARDLFDGSFMTIFNELSTYVASDVCIF